MHALYRAGRQPEALAVWPEVSQHLNKTIAVDSRKALQRLHERILRQEDDLLRPEAVSFPSGETGTQARAQARPGRRAHHDSQPGESQEMHDPTGQTDENDSAEAHGPGDGSQRKTADVGPSLVFNGPIHAPHSVFGSQVHYNGAR